MSSATMHQPTGQQGQGPRRYSPMRNLALQGLLIVLALAMRYVFHSDWKATLFLFFAVPALAARMLLRDGRGRVPVAVAITPSIIAAILGIVMLATPAGSTVSLPTTPNGSGGGGAADLSEVAPAVTQPSVVNDLDARLLAWNAKVPIGTSPETEPSADQNNEVWIQMFNFWANDVMNPESSYDGAFRGDITMADTVVATVPGPLYPVVKDGIVTTALVDKYQTYMMAGGPGVSSRMLYATFYTSDGGHAEHQAKFELHVDSTGRTHLLVDLIK